MMITPKNNLELRAQAVHLIEQQKRFVLFARADDKIPQTFTAIGMKGDRKGDFSNLPVKEQEEELYQLYALLLGIYDFLDQYPRRDTLYRNFAELKCKKEARNGESDERSEDPLDSEEDNL